MYRVMDRVRRRRPDGRAGVPGPHRLPGEGARLPHRAGRDRGAAGGAPGRARSGRPGARGRARRPAAGGVLPGGRAGRRGRAEGAPRRVACRGTWCRRRTCGWRRIRSRRTARLDRKALPAPEGDAYAAREYEAPVGETEQAVAAIWAEVLGAERVGRGDDFFELGGHSLLAVRVVSRVRQALGVEASPRDLFERPVLADFARGLETAARAEATGDRARGARRAAAALVRAAAAVVPGAAGGRWAAPTTSPCACGCAATWTAARWCARWTASSRATRRCARPSRRWTASRSSASPRSRRARSGWWSTTSAPRRTRRTSCAAWWRTRRARRSTWRTGR